jgi:hypothetical protein
MPASTASWCWSRPSTARTAGRAKEYRRIKRNEALAEEQLRHAHREFSWHVDEGGCWVVRGRLTAEQGAVVARALEAAMDRAFEEQRGEPEEVEREIVRERCRSGFAEPIAQRPDGTPLPNAPDGRSRGNFDAIREANAAEGLEITSHTAYGELDGDPVDWQLAMLELIQRE